MFRFLLIVLFVANALALGLYLHDQYPPIEEAIARVGPLDDAIGRGNDALVARGLGPVHVLGAAAGLVFLLLVATWLRHGQKRKRTGGKNALGKLAALAIFGGLIALFVWITYHEDDTMSLGPFRFERGQRADFLAFSLHIFLLVLEAHVLFILGAALYVGRKKVKKKPA